MLVVGAVHCTKRQHAAPGFKGCGRGHLVRSKGEVTQGTANNLPESWLHHGKRPENYESNGCLIQIIDAYSRLGFDLSSIQARCQGT